MAGKHASTQAQDEISDQQPQQPVTVESEILGILDARRARRT